MDCAQELHLHPSGIEDEMAVSPNNCAFILNFRIPLTSFTILSC